MSIHTTNIICDFCGELELLKTSKECGSCQVQICKECDEILQNFEIKRGQTQYEANTIIECCFCTNNPFEKKFTREDIFHYVFTKADLTYEEAYEELQQTYIQQSKK